MIGSVAIWDWDLLLQQGCEQNLNVCSMLISVCPCRYVVTLFYIIRMSNFAAEAECSYFVSRFEAENILITFLSYML